ncbi:MAG: copper transporter, partial [Actinomycetia bacterium]|nr:copper transporter [Actinomycetes bacterium]
NASMKDGLDNDITTAGGQVVGRLQLTSNYTDPRRATDLTSLVTNPDLRPLGLTLPTTGDAGDAAGALLAWVLVGNGTASDLTQVITGLSAGAYLTVDKSPHPARAIVVVGNGALPAGDVGGKMLLALVNQLQAAGAFVVVAGDAAAATKGGLVALVRGDDAARNAVCTVDNADTAMGQVSTIIALAEAVAGQSAQSSHYGTGAGAKALFPDPLPVTGPTAEPTAPPTGAPTASPSASSSAATPPTAATAGPTGG